MIKFDDLIHFFGNQNRMARKLNVSRQAVNHWKKSGVVPPSVAIEIERMTNGKFRAVDLT